MTDDAVIPAPIETAVQRVDATWIDENGHMNVAYYLLAFDRAIDEAFAKIGLGTPYKSQGQGTTFALEARIRYLREVMEDDPLKFTFQLLDMDEKRLHTFITMTHAEAGYVAATIEGMTIHINQATRRSAPFPPDRLALLRRVCAAHHALPRPEGLDRPIGIRR